MNTSGKRQVKAEAQNANRHAVVLGGSLAGLLTARILSDHFDHVTLIERDAYLDTSESFSNKEKRHEDTNGDNCGNRTIRCGSTATEK